MGHSSIRTTLGWYTHIEESDIITEALKEGNQDTIIGIVFDNLPDKIVLDAMSTTNLRNEHLLNSEDYLEVIKKFHNGGAPKVFIRANHPTNPGCAGLLLKKNAE